MSPPLQSFGGVKTYAILSLFQHIGIFSKDVRVTVSQVYHVLSCVLNELVCNTVILTFQLYESSSQDYATKWSLIEIST